MKGAAADIAGEVLTSDLGLLLSWMGYHPEDHELQELVTEIDRDKSGTVSQFEIPLFMRKYRELELDKVGHFFGMKDKDSSGSIDVAELEELLQVMGYPMAKRSMMDFLDETRSSRAAERGLVFEDFWR